MSKIVLKNRYDMELQIHELQVRILTTLFTYCSRIELILLWTFDFDHLIVLPHIITIITRYLALSLSLKIKKNKSASENRIDYYCSYYYYYYHCNYYYNEKIWIILYIILSISINNLIKYLFKQTSKAMAKHNNGFALGL